MTVRARALAKKANDRLARLGATMAEESFVCPTCLRLRPIGEATEAHFPSRTVRAVRRRTEVQCVDCNSGIGGTYEKAGVDFMEFTRTITMTKPDGSGARLQTRAKVRNKDGAIAIDLVSSRRGRRRTPVVRTRARLDRVLDGSAEPRAMGVAIARPTEEVAKRAIMAWSFLELFRYAGYRYVASPGAELARRLILDPRLTQPEGTFYMKGTVSLPLGEPAPVLVVRRDGPDDEEPIALGVQWGGMVAVFPFANDEDERAWSRVAELLSIDQLRTTYARRLRAFHPLLIGEVDTLVEIRDDAGTRRGITVELSSSEVAELAAGRSRRRLDPPKGRGWSPTMTVEHNFVTVEGDPPRPPPARVAYWANRLLAKGGGFLPRIVGELMDEVPGAPKPIPDPFPLQMRKTAAGWRALIAVSPNGIDASGATPADAVAVLLAMAEREFATVPPRAHDDGKG